MLLELFCHVDDFCQQFADLSSRKILRSEENQRDRAIAMYPSEIMTILIHFHQSRYRDFKSYYNKFVCPFLSKHFPTLPSYTRFVEWQSRCLLLLTIYLVHCFGHCSGTSFVDSTKLSVCHNRRIGQHKTFAGLAERGKTSVDWFYGFKLHLLINDVGQILWLQLTPGNVDDRKSLFDMVNSPMLEIFGTVTGDKGYISQKLFQHLLTEHHLRLVTGLKKNMHPRTPALSEDALLLRQRSIIETVIDQLKNISQIEHSRHRSPKNFLVNLMCGLIAYCHQPKKPSLLGDPSLLLPAA